jgi:hypothetical protein
LKGRVAATGWDWAQKSFVLNLNLKPKLKRIRKICVIFKKIKFFFEKKGCRHWLGLGPKIIWAYLNPKPKLKRIRNFFVILFKK